MIAAVKAKPAPLAQGEEVVDLRVLQASGVRVTGTILRLVEIGRERCAVVRGEGAGGASTAWLICDSVSRWARASEAL